MVACGGNADAPAPAASATTAPVETASPTATNAPPAATATQAPSPTPERVRQDIRATRLAIPALDLDAEVQTAPTVPYVYIPEPGCPPGPESTETVTVPDQGIATPADNLEGLENKAWVYGHSRWLGVPGLFFGLQDVSLGDELFMDGVDRASGEALSGLRFVVDGIYLTDIDSGEAFLTTAGPEDVPDEPIVVLQTSVRERGAGRPWIFEREALTAKAENLVVGDLDDPCKYLLLFITASPA